VLSVSINPGKNSARNASRQKDLTGLAFTKAVGDVNAPQGAEERLSMRAAANRTWKEIENANSQARQF
jgi:hypothetical protein